MWSEEEEHLLFKIAKGCKWGEGVSLLRGRNASPVRRRWRRLSSPREETIDWMGIPSPPPSPDTARGVDYLLDLLDYVDENADDPIGKVFD